MTTTQTIQLLSINIQIDEQGNIVGKFYKEQFLKDLSSIPAGKHGTIRFKCEKRRTPPKSGPDRTHTLPIFEIRTEVNDIAEVPADLDTFDVEEKL